MSPETPVLGSTPLVAVVRFQDGGPVLEAVEALGRGGIELVEITIDTPGALEAVDSAARNGRTMGVGTLCLAGVKPWSLFPVLWFDWWLGDALGAVVVAPALLTAWTRLRSKTYVLRALPWIGASASISFSARRSASARIRSST